MGCGWHGSRGDIDQWRARATERVNRAAERWEQKRGRWEERMQHWRGHHSHGLRPSGNHAFDEYREEALRRLEEGQTSSGSSCTGYVPPRIAPNSTSSCAIAAAARADRAAGRARLTSPSRSRRSDVGKTGWRPVSATGRHFFCANPGRIRPGGRHLAGWRAASAKVPSERHSSSRTSRPFRSAATHLAPPSRACPACRHPERLLAAP